MSRTKNPLRFVNESHAVYADVRRQFGDRLPPGWEDLVALACFPGAAIEQAAWTTDEGKPVNNPPMADPPENYRAAFPWKCYAHDPPTVDPLKDNKATFWKCYAHDPDLVLEIMTFARSQLAEYDPKQQQGRAHSGFVRAVLLGNWNKVLVEKKNKEWWSPTPDELKLIANRKAAGLKTALLWELKDNAIIDWIHREYRLKVGWQSFRKARRSIS
jgi:hypothetical protein